MLDTNEKLERIIKILDEKKAENIELFDVKKRSSICDYIVITTANSTTHLKALIGILQKELKALNEPATSTEGENNSSSWSCIDCNDIFVHIMLKDVREHYKLEQIWLSSKKEPTKGE